MVWDKTKTTLLTSVAYLPKMTSMKSVKNTPIIMERACGHILTANFKALSLAGITKDTIAVAGGEIDHDRAGELTGILKENACAMVKKIIKKKRPQRKDSWL